MRPRESVTFDQLTANTSYAFVYEGGCMNPVHMINRIDTPDPRWVYFNTGSGQFYTISAKEIEDRSIKIEPCNSQHYELHSKLLEYNEKQAAREKKLVYMPVKCAGPGCNTEHDKEEMYRCLYCKDWRCEACARSHFGHKYLTSLINHLVGTVNDVIIAFANSSFPYVEKKKDEALRKMRDSFNRLRQLDSLDEKEIAEQVKEILAGVQACRSKVP